MTNNEKLTLFNEFNIILIKIVKAYLKFDHLTNYKVNFDTGEKVKEIYEISIKRVKGGEEQ